MKDDIDRHLHDTLVCPILAYMAVILNERDLAFGLFLLIWCHLQRSPVFSAYSQRIVHYITDPISRVFFTEKIQFMNFELSVYYTMPS